MPRASPRRSRRPGARNRNPTPRTVSIQPGSPSFLRSDATCTSSVFVGPYQCGSQTFSSSSWRGRTAPASSARNARRSNSFGVSATTSPSTLTRRVRRSTVSAPTSTTDGGGRQRAVAVRRAVPVAVRCRGRGVVGRRHRRAATDDGADARDELAEAERLDDVVVGAELQPDDPVDLFGARGHHDDRHVGARPQLAAHVEAVAVGQAEVEQHHVEPRRRAAIERVAAGLHAVDRRGPPVRGPWPGAWRWRRRPRRSGLAWGSCSLLRGRVRQGTRARAAPARCVDIHGLPLEALSGSIPLVESQVVGHTRLHPDADRPIGAAEGLTSGIREAGMRRRKLVATAGALSVTAFAATLAIGANFGLVGQAEPSSPIGRLDDHRQVVASAAHRPAGRGAW